MASVVTEKPSGTSTIMATGTTNLKQPYGAVEIESLLDMSEPSERAGDTEMAPHFAVQVPADISGHSNPSTRLLFLADPGAEPDPTDQEEELDPSNYLIPELLGLHAEHVHHDAHSGDDEEAEETEDPDEVDDTVFGRQLPLMTRRRVEFDAALEAQEAERAERNAHKYKPTKKEELRYESDDTDEEDVLDPLALGPIHIENLERQEREMYGNSAIRHYKDYNGQRARRVANVKLDYEPKISPPWPRNNTPLEKAYYFCVLLGLDPLYELMECRNLMLCVHSNVKQLGKDRFSILFKDALRSAVVMMQHVERDHIRNFKQNFDNNFLNVISWLNNQDMQGLRYRRQEIYQKLYHITRDLTAKCSKFLECYDLILDPSRTRPEAIWRCLVHTLDLGLLSYIGRHVDPIDEKYLGVPRQTFTIPGPFALPAAGEIKSADTVLDSIPKEMALLDERFQALNPIMRCPPVAQVPLPAKIPIVEHELITLCRHPVAYLEKYLEESPLWIFHLTTSPLPYAPLYLSADVDTLTNTWGPGWGGLHEATFGMGKIVAWFPGTRKPVVLDVEGIDDDEKKEKERLAQEKEQRRLELERRERKRQEAKRREEEEQKKQGEEATKQKEAEQDTSDGWTTVTKKKPASGKPDQTSAPAKAAFSSLTPPSGPATMAKPKLNAKNRANVRNMLAKTQQAAPPAAKAPPPMSTISTYRAACTSRTDPQSSRVTTPPAWSKSSEVAQSSYPPILAKAAKKSKKSDKSNAAAIKAEVQKSKPSPITIAPLPLLTPPASDSAPSPNIKDWTSPPLTSATSLPPRTKLAATTTQNQIQDQGHPTYPSTTSGHGLQLPASSPLPSPLPATEIPISLPLALDIGFKSLGSRPCISDFQIEPIPPSTTSRSECPSLGTSPAGSRQGSPVSWKDEGPDQM